MAHIRLDIGADRAASLRTMKEDISAIVDALNKEPKLKQIKLGLNMSELSKDTNKLKTKINELRKDAAEIKFSDQISNSLNGITSSLETLTNSVAGIAGLKNELLALSEAMRSFQGIHINLGLSDKNPIQRMSEYGQSARQTITKLKTQAAEMEKIFAQTFKYTNSYREAVLAAANGTGIWEKRGTNPIDLMGSLSGNGSLSSQMTAWQNYISLMKDLANIKGVDVSSVKTNAAELVQSTKEIMTGSQEASQGMEKLKGIFGSGINSEQLIGKLDEIRLAIDRIVESLTNLSAKEVKIKFDDASLENLRTQISQLLTEMSAVTDKAGGTPKTSSSSSGGSKSSSSAKYDYSAIQKYYSLLYEVEKKETDIINQDGRYVSVSGKWDKYAASLNNAKAKLDNLTSEEAKSKMSKEELLNLTTRLSAAEEEYGLKVEALQNKQANAQATKEAAQAEREYAAAKRQANAEEKAAAQETKIAEATARNYTNAISQGESALKRYSAAERSRHQESRVAYQNLANSLENLKATEAQYGRGSKEVAAATASFKSTLKETQAVLIANGDATQSFTTKLSGLAKKFGSWLTVSQAIMYAIRSVRRMISTAIEIDSAFTQLKIVTGATNDEMKKFGATAINLAKELGKSVTETTSAIETFSRLGYTLQEATSLSKYSSILSNVAGVSSDEATTGLTSIVKGFNLKVSDAEHVADVLVDVGQKYAVSAGELMEAYEKSGAALSATNTSLEKSAGLIAAANASVQDSSVVGTALKTVSARIRGKNFCASVYSNIHAQARQAA